MHAVLHRFVIVGTLAVSAAALAVLGGCLIPGINDGTADDGGAAARSQALYIAPERITPLANQNVTTAVAGLVWTAAPGATEYDVYFGADPNPPLVATVATPGFTLFDLPSCQTHYWRIVARNDAQAISSPTWTFKTMCP